MNKEFKEGSPVRLKPNIEPKHTNYPDNDFSKATFIVSYYTVDTADKKEVSCMIDGDHTTYTFNEDQLDHGLISN